MTPEYLQSFPIGNPSVTKVTPEYILWPLGYLQNDPKAFLNWPTVWPKVSPEQPQGDLQSIPKVSLYNTTVTREYPKKDTREILRWIPRYLNSELTLSLRLQTTISTELSYIDHPTVRIEHRQKESRDMAKYNTRTGSKIFIINSYQQVSAAVDSLCELCPKLLLIMVFYYQLWTVDENC